MATAVRFLRRTLRASQASQVMSTFLEEKRLLEVLPEKSSAIIASANQQMMTDVVPYPFRQNGDYLYLTGCTQPGGAAVLSEETGFCMFMPDTSKEDVVWQGQTAGVEAAVDFFKADKAFPLSQMQKSLLQTMLLSRTHREESQLAAKIEYECKMRGAQRMA